MDVRETAAVTISAIGSLLLAAGFTLCGVAAAAERRNELVHYKDVHIDVVIEGNGPAVVLLPSLARDSDDYDEVAEGLAAAGFRVLRPTPRGIGYIELGLGSLAGRLRRTLSRAADHHVAMLRQRRGSQCKHSCKQESRGGTPHQDPSPLRGFAGTGFSDAELDVTGTRLCCARRRCRYASYSTTAPAAETFNEATFPAIGIRSR